MWVVLLTLWRKVEVLPNHLLIPLHFHLETLTQKDSIPPICLGLVAFEGLTLHQRHNPVFHGRENSFMILINYRKHLKETVSHQKLVIRRTHPSPPCVLLSRDSCWVKVVSQELSCSSLASVYNSPILTHFPELMQLQCSPR